MTNERKREREKLKAFLEIKLNVYNIEQEICNRVTKDMTYFKGEISGFGEPMSDAFAEEM